MASLHRYLKYNENVVFNISRVGGLHWERSSWAGPHGEERGKKYGDYCQERRAQCGEGNKESGAHCGLQGHSIVEPTNWIRNRSPLHDRRRDGRFDEAQVSNTNCSKLSNRVWSFSF